MFELICNACSLLYRHLPASELLQPSSQLKLNSTVKAAMNTTDVNSHIQRMMSFLSPKLTVVLLGCGFLLFLVVIGVLANIAVCSVLVRDRRFKKHISNFMLFHLSITDMVYRLIVVPAQLIALMLPIQNKPALLCKFAKTLTNAVHTAVFSSLVVIALDRQQSITKPFKRLGHNPKFHLHVLVIWGYSIVISTPQIYIEEVIKFAKRHSSKCRRNEQDLSLASVFTQQRLNSKAVGNCLFYSGISRTIAYHNSRVLQNRCLSVEKKSKSSHKSSCFEIKGKSTSDACVHGFRFCAVSGYSSIERLDGFVRF